MLPPVAGTIQCVRLSPLGGQDWKSNPTVAGARVGADAAATCMSMAPLADGRFGFSGEDLAKIYAGRDRLGRRRCHCPHGRRKENCLWLDKPS